MTKAEEIKTLQSLKGDTYFAQVFPNHVIDQMCENIKMDFALDSGIEIFEYSLAAQSWKAKYMSLKDALNDVQSEDESLKRTNKELLEILAPTALKAGLSYESKEYKQIVSLVGQRCIILAKIKHGYALTDKEKEYLTNNLN